MIWPSVVCLCFTGPSWLMADCHTSQSLYTAIPVTSTLSVYLGAATMESHLGFYSAFPDIGNSNSRYRKINFRYREIIDFPISGNDFRISGIDFPISGNVFDFPISENRPTEAGHSATLQHRPINKGPGNTGPVGDRHYDFSKSQCLYIHMQNSISATNNNHTTDYLVQKYRNLWRWINVLNDINKNSTLR